MQEFSALNDGKINKHYCYHLPEKGPIHHHHHKRSLVTNAFA
jgi:hypothetical protein